MLDENISSGAPAVKAVNSSRPSGLYDEYCGSHGIKTASTDIDIDIAEAEANPLYHLDLSMDVFGESPEIFSPASGCSADRGDDEIRQPLEINPA
ncbi:MAG TPA: hypothetical protein PLL55_10055, partial [Candidatus Aminicenantes bacterium]|nr:hypothetical protein [Candidatus Aminicenantes bacterium]